VQQLCAGSLGIPPSELALYRELVGYQQHEIAVGVTTAPRRVTTLDRCLTSIVNAGFSEPVIFAEPDSKLSSYAKQFRVIQREHKFGAWRNWLWGSKGMLSLFPGAEGILMVQDDTELSPHCRGIINASLWPDDCGMIQLCTSASYHRNIKPNRLGVLKINGRNYFLAGACACLFPRHVLHRIVSYGMRYNWRGWFNKHEPDPTKKKGIDTFIGRALSWLHLNPWYFRPSLAAHFGAVSSLGHGNMSGNRRTLDYIGDAIPQHDIPPATPPNKQIAVVIPAAGDCPDMLRECLAAVGEHCREETIIFDNGISTETRTAAVAAAVRWGLPLRIIGPGTNTGFSHACNEGIRAAGDKDVLLLNSDCMVAPGCVSGLQRVLRLCDKCAAVGPMTADGGHQSVEKPKRKKQADLRGCLKTPRNVVQSSYRFAKNTSSTEPMLAFFCTLLSREAIDDVGLLREDGALASGLGADDEWCIRARRKGWNVRLAHGAYAFHDHHATFRLLGQDRRQQQRESVAQLKSEGVL